MDLFTGFDERNVDVSGGVIHARIGGDGPPVLLLHGYPETHAAWHRVAPQLSKSFSVVAADLPGYGESLGASQGAPLDQFSKRVWAAMLIEAMDRLGYSSFTVIGHDRGGRVAYRMALDHPSRVKALVSLTVVPTTEVWQRVNSSFAMGAYHWFMLAQPFDLPERLIGADPDYFLDWTLTRMGASDANLHPAALASYRASFRKAEVRHAICQDYRCAASFDLQYDTEDRRLNRRIACPTLILWTDKRVRSIGDAGPLEIWRDWATNVRGSPIAAGHLLPEEAPDQVLAEAIPFLKNVMHS